MLDSVNIWIQFKYTKLHLEFIKNMRLITFQHNLNKL